VTSAAAEVGAQLVRAGALLEEGKLVEAEDACLAVLSREPANPAATHLLGLIRARGGDAAAGEQLIRRSIEFSPDDPNLRLNLATFLRRHGRLADATRAYRRVLQLDPQRVAARAGLALSLEGLGRVAEAEAECRALLAVSPQDARGWSALGAILTRRGRLPEAESAYRRALALNPRLGPAHQQLGALLVRMDRAEEALAQLGRSQSLGLRGFDSCLARARALVQLGRVTEAESDFAQAVKLAPRHVQAQLELARLRQACGDADFARSLIAAVGQAPEDFELRSKLTALLARTGRAALAEELLREELRRAGPQPQLRLQLSQVLREGERLAEAETHALEAAAALPDDPAAVENLVSILLSRGRAQEALAFIRTQRTSQPLSQRWLAWETTAVRLLGQDSYREWSDYARFVRCYPLEPPAGFASMAALNAALIRALATRHHAGVQPLAETARCGSQSLHNLVADPEPAIQAVLSACAPALAEYTAGLGCDARHPFTARNFGKAVMTEAWSVHLGRDGHHVNHYHDQGWISSAYYAAVPEESDDAALRSGWLKFGEPRFPTPGATAELQVRPVAGMLVLFPSYLWHGTNPLHGMQPRIALAFDAVPPGAGA
jgi:Flp pilus assembly protein TadD